MKRGIIAALFIFAILNFTFVSALVRINEIELNPAGDDNKNEWIELYADGETDLNGWKIVNAKGSEFSLNFIFEGYYIAYAPYRFLSNSKQKLKLYDQNNEIIQESNEITDNANDRRTWQNCEGRWEFLDGSREGKNACENEEEEKATVEDNPENSDEETRENDNDNKEENDNAIINEPENIENQENKTGSLLAQEVIKLEPKGIKSEKVWKSRTGYIKEYSLLGFTLLCIIALIVMIRIYKYGQDKFSNDF